MITVTIDEDLGLAPDDSGRWYTFCETHGELCQHRTIALARSWSAEPDGWCAGCRAIIREREELREYSGGVA